MIKNTFKHILLVCLMALPFGVMAQRASDPLSRAELFDKNWEFVGMKCPDKIGAESHYIHWFASLRLTVSNSNNVNYGTYTKTYRDMRDNPREMGTYALNTDEVGNLVLTLKKNKTGVMAKYIVPTVSTNHLTLIRMDETDKCNISYAIAP